LDHDIAVDYASVNFIFGMSKILILMLAVNAIDSPLWSIPYFK